MQRTPPKKNQKRQSTLVRREQIIDASRRLIVKYGSEHVTVRRIAAEIGISEGALYRHFTSKKEVLLFLIRHIEENLIGDFGKRSLTKNILGTLEDILRNHLSSVEQRRGISFLVIAEIISLGDKELNKRVLEVLSKYISNVKKLLLEGIKAGEIRKDINPEMVATSFFGTMQGLITVWALNNYNFALEKKFTALWDLFQKAIRKD
jgi:TetR/AcrR family fatty acid metabolism transcriptional regulator